MTPAIALPIDRRALLALVPGFLLSPAASARDFIGEAARVRGTVMARQSADVRSLTAGAGLMLKDTIQTESDSFATLALAGLTTVHLGSRARLLIDRFVAEAGGVLELGEGALLLDRAEELPKLDLTIRSSFGRIAVRGTRFFAGPSRGVFGVFVARGAVEVEAAGMLRQLTAGEGVDIPTPGAAPGDVRTWGEARIAEALASVGL